MQRNSFIFTEQYPGCVGTLSFSQLEEAKASMLALENDKRFSRDLMSGLRNMRLCSLGRLMGVRMPLQTTERGDERGYSSYQSKFLNIRDYKRNQTESHSVRPS